jgi:selenocysteine lyase/cysteine desulfurase
MLLAIRSTLDGATALGMIVPAQTAPHIVGLFPADGQPSAEALATAVKNAGIVISLRSGALRISLHVYNTAANVDTLLRALQAAVHGGQDRGGQ